MKNMPYVVPKSAIYVKDDTTENLDVVRAGLSSRIWWDGTIGSASLE